MPQVVSLGALDMVNFGPRDTVPERFAGRNLYVHNPSVTLMRTTPEECAELGRRLGAKLSAATGPVALFVPLRGVSAIAGRGRPLLRPRRRRGAARGAAARPSRPAVELHEVDAHINDPEFAAAMAARLDEFLGGATVNGDEARQRLRQTLADGGTIVGAGAGTGLSAKCAEAGGADLIIIYNSGRYRMAGRGSLAGLMPYGDANAIVMEMAARGAARRPGDPGAGRRLRHRPLPADGPLPRQIEDAGFAGVQNFPTVGLIDGVFRANLEETGMSYAQEVEMIGLAAERGLLTAPYVFDVESAEAMTRAGADVLVPHMGLTTKGSIGAHTAQDPRRLRRPRSRRCATPRSRSTPT